MDPLFEPIKINKMEVKNRIWLPTMHLNMVHNYEVTDQICEFYAERARGGAGAICIGFVSVDRGGSMPPNIGAHDDKYIPGLAKLASAVKDNGAKIIAQVNHTGRQTYGMMLPKGMQPVAPSAVRVKMTGETPRELTEDEIWDIIEKFGKTAERLVKAGYDGIEPLMGTGYMVSSFLSPLSNKRTDKWGGSLENRMRFGVEVMKSMRKAVGPDFPIVPRMNGNDLMKDGIGSMPHVEFAQALVDAGADGLCINVGWHEARVPQITMGVPRCNFTYQARRIKEKVNVPVIASHRINDVEDARALIMMKYCDMVAMGRALIADPYLPEKAKEGREEEIIHCVACGQGCFDHVFYMKPVECMVNPEAGHELDGPVPKAETKKKIAVVGGGPAGMSAALTAKKRGHEVTLFEREAALGGQLYLASAPPGREEFLEIADDYEMQLHLANVDIRLSVEVTVDMLKEGGYDEIILATGAEPIAPPIPGADGANVIQSWDYLEGLAGEPMGNIVVVGGGSVGVEVAVALAEVGTVPPETLRFLMLNDIESLDELKRLAVYGTNNVTLVEMLPRLAQDMGKSTRWTILAEVENLNINVMKKTKVLEIKEDSVIVETESGQETIPADTVILAAGSKSYNPLEEKLKAAGLSAHTIGDARKIGLVFTAIHEGYKLARGL